MTRARKILDVAGEQRLHPVGIGLANLRRPASVRGRGDFALRVALDVARRLRQLQPEDRLSLRRSRRIERGRLTDADRWLGGQEAALAFVGGARNAVETGRDVEKRDLAKFVAAFPSRRRVERVVDLHVALAVAIVLERLLSLGRGGMIAQEPSIELGRRHRADDSLARLRSALPNVSSTARARPSAPRLDCGRHPRRTGCVRHCRRSAARRRRPGSSRRRPRSGNPPFRSRRR